MSFLSRVIAVVSSVALAGLLLVIRRAQFGMFLTPDGKQYGAIETAQRPFCLRWLVPVLFRRHLKAWSWFTGGSLVVCAALCAALALQAGLGTERAIFAAALFCGLPGLFHVNATIPLLVDAPALAFMFAAVLASDVTWLAVGLVVVGAMVKETVPIFAAAATLNPWLLLGLVPVAIAAVVTRKRSTANLGWKKQLPKLLNAMAVLLPWGACLAALWAPTPAMLVSLVLGYGLLAWASDTARIYQWAAAPMIVATAAIIPDAWLLPVALAHLFSPFLGDIV